MEHADGSLACQAAPRCKLTKGRQTSELGFASSQQKPLKEQGKGQSCRLQTLRLLQLWLQAV
eukprot:6343982-Amphidinium_carterae.1